MRVTYQRELKMKSQLDELGIENFVPMQYEVTGQGARASTNWCLPSIT